MAFRREERSYYSTPDGWRLATFEEAINGLDMIKEKHLLKKWDRVRLLDGWITGPGYNYEMGNDFKGCLGYMLLIQTEASAPYADVNLSEWGKEVALFLCVDDWNYEVVYWLLNCWSKFETMNLGDVRGGNIPFIKATEFEEKYKMFSSVARRLGDEEGAAREKAGMPKYCGRDSVKEALSGMIKIVTEEKDIVQVLGDYVWQFIWYRGDEYCLPESVQTGDVDEAFWSFVYETFAGNVVELCAHNSLTDIRQMKTKSRSQGNMMIATYILFYLSAYRTDIIHEPLAHRCKGSCARKILSYAAEKAVGDPHSLSQMLKSNAMWRCYNDTGNYGVLNKLLIAAVNGRYNDFEQAEKIAVSVVDVLLECGAQPEGSYGIGKHKYKTALNHAARFKDEDLGIKVAESLLIKCNKKTKRGFVDAADEIGRTALHRASEKGNARICQLLVGCGASLKAQDTKGMTALHYAVQGAGIDEVIDVFTRSSDITDLVDLQDKRGYSPLDIVVVNKDLKSSAKLLSKSKKPESYFKQVDQKQLLRYSLLAGSVEIVFKLFENGISLPDGDCDEEGKTALHLAAMCDNEFSATKIFLKIMQESSGNVQNMVARRDKRGRTVFHEAALNGYMQLCAHLLEKNQNLIYSKDRDGRNPLYDAVKGKYEGTDLYNLLLAAYLEKDMAEDDLMDRSGLTPLHVAASQGKAQLVKELLSSDNIKSKYLSRGDFLGQTALHKAAKRGDLETVIILLQHGAHPLNERDCDGRTALHYAVQAGNGDKEELARTLLRQCQSEKEKSLLLWASAAGLGTADQNLRKDDPLYTFLVVEKRKFKECNLLKTAASVGDIGMTKELIRRGYQIGDIRDPEWKKNLNSATLENVERVSGQIEMIKEQANDKPAISDSLGRLDYAQGLVALFLNPYIKPPIAVGITGTWGMGKSSLMVQTEHILLTTAAQMALLESSKLPSSALELPDIKPYKLSRKGERKCENIYKQIKYGEIINRNLNIKKIQEELEKFLNKYDRKYRKVFKSLAAMDSSDMFETNAPRPKTDPLAEENVPAVLTVQYNAWKYRNDTEALAGMAVEITKELEGIMTQAQWLNTCWRNTWKKKKYALWIEIFFPSLLALVLVSSFTWIAWVVLDSDKLKEWGKAKYAWPPAAVVIMVWSLTKSVMGVLKPVSTQLMQYISFPDHTDKLGYQERVISDINFLKKEIGKKAFWVFIIFGWVFTTFTVLWRLITESWVISILFHHESIEKALDSPKVAPASGSNLRIIVFVDDLDRCQESVILQVLSAINLVLAECEINVVMGMDKKLIQRAIMKKYGDVKANRSLKASQELADMYLQKIIQLPLDLPEPSEEQSTEFLKVQLGVFEEERHPDSASATDAHSTNSCDLVMGDVGLREPSNDQEIEASQTEAPSQNTTAQDLAINVEPPSRMTESSSSGDRRPIVGDGRALQVLWNTLLRKEARSESTDANTGSSSPSSLILIREMLFVKYSRGEQGAFFFFKERATGCRKLPREWKRLLNYHRLVWYIFFLSNEAKVLAGWQVQLITWLFICWEWEENMNCLIENWNNLGDLEISDSNEPSLFLIVDYFIVNYVSNKNKMTDATHEEHPEKEWSSLFKSEDPAVSVGKNIQEAESSNRESETIEEDARDQLARNGAVSFPHHTKKRKNKKKKKMVVTRETNPERNIDKNKANSESIKNPSPETLESVVKLQLEEFKKEMEVMIEQTMKKNSGKNKKQEKETKDKLQNWWRMRYVLYRYDVSMECIRAFQRFRFYCVAGYLQWPPAKQDYYDEAMISFFVNKKYCKNLNDTP